MNHVLLAIGISGLWIIHTSLLNNAKEHREKIAKERAQEKAIARLYPQGHFVQ